MSRRIRKLLNTLTLRVIEYLSKGLMLGLRMVTKGLLINPLRLYRFYCRDSLELLLNL